VNGEHGQFSKTINRLFRWRIALENAMPSYSADWAFLRRHDRAPRTLRLAHGGRLAALPQRIFHAASLRNGSQTEEPVEWRAEDFLTEEPARASVPLEDRAALNCVAGAMR